MERTLGTGLGICAIAGIVNAAWLYLFGTPVVYCWLGPVVSFVWNQFATFFSLVLIGWFLVSVATRGPWFHPLALYLLVATIPGWAATLFKMGGACH